MRDHIPVERIRIDGGTQPRPVVVVAPSPVERTEMQTVDWLSSLKVGDSVVVERGYVYTALSLETVTHATATQVHVGRLKFRRADGRSIGGGTYDRIAITQPTPERLNAIRRMEAIDALSNVRWEAFGDDDLFAAFDVIVNRNRKRRDVATNPEQPVSAEPS
jgi:hypothetical protein